jgi:hypothetical protein
LETETDFHLLSFRPLRGTKLKPKGIKRLVRGEIEVVDIHEDNEKFESVVRIDPKSRIVQMPNGELWNFGGHLRYPRLGVDTCSVWLDTTSTPTEFRSKCSPWFDELSNRALSRIKYPWRKLGTTMRFIPMHRRGRRRALGTAFCHSNRIEIYLQYWDTSQDVAQTVAHEIGHIVDWRFLNDEDRMRWRELRGFSRDYPWYSNRFRPDWKDPCGDFAECFAAWLLPNSAVQISKPMCQETLATIKEWASDRNGILVA